MSNKTDPPSEFIDGTDSPNRIEPFPSETPPRASTASTPPRRESAAPKGASPAAVGTTTDPMRLLGAFASGAPFIALVAAVETLIATVLLGVQLTAAPVVVALVTFAVYTVDHVADADADAVSTPHRALLARRYGDQLMIAATLAYGTAVALAITGGPLALAVTLLPGAFWVAYASDWLPDLGQAVSAALSAVVPRGRLSPGAAAGATDGGRRYVPRLKDVLVVNSVVVAAGWATALTFLPVAFTGAAVGPAVPVVFAYFFLRSFVDAELPNVRDVAADTAVGVETLPVAVGVVRTRRLLYGVDLLAAGAVTAAGVAGLLAWPLVGALGVGVAASVCVTSLAGRIDDASVLGVAPDCTYLLVGVAIAGVTLVG
ncbi:UbiA family prenyltransferase [Halorubrum depositum]|uniref:UbiA family prenyltransferase n=1 Tax=Halorubrum depositum TaxID=2583992 RepID=UPI00119F651A|nr:UbiA family prenyltransferase [Halorubrum depositum]